MSLEDRVKALREKHQDIEKVLEEEENRPLPDNIVIHDLKRQKLAIKDEIARLTHP
ncbi:MAG: YdcH family protein [Rhodospirillales bacterium]|nr:MAG: YdcH family protein [Rhodospirillales bacterium]